MNAFKAFWLCALENGNTSAEDVWRGALEWIYNKRNANGLCEDCYCDIDSRYIKGELNDKQTNRQSKTIVNKAKGNIQKKS